MAKLTTLMIVSTALVSLCAGCQKQQAQGAVAEAAGTPTLKVRSQAFADGKPIPQKHAYRGEGENVSPPLSWSGAPAGTKSFAIISDDPDAPSPKKPGPRPWVHWVLYNIPAQRTALAAGDSGDGVSGLNDFHEKGWSGPLPPRGSGVHRYFFRVYALDTKLKFEAPPTKGKLLAAMAGHILAQGKIHGTYQRD